MARHDLELDDAAPRSTLLAAAISGLLYFFVALVPQVDGPDVETATADQIRAFLSTHDGSLRTLAVANALAIALVVVFSTSVARLIRSRDDRSQLADLVVAGGILVAVWHWIVVAGTAMTVVQALDGTDLASVDDATLVGWYGISNFTHLFADLGMLGIATVMASASVAIVRTGLLARWVGWLGIVLAAGGALGTLGITSAWVPLADVWFVGIFGWWAWVLIVAVGCGVRARRHAVARPAAASQPA